MQHTLNNNNNNNLSIFYSLFIYVLTQWPNVQEMSHKYHVTDAKATGSVCKSVFTWTCAGELVSWKWSCKCLTVYQAVTFS